MDLKSIFNSFSRRQRDAATKSGQKSAYDVPESSRNRILMWSNELFAGRGHGMFDGGGDYRLEFWDEIHRALRYRRGAPQLAGRSDSYEDVIAYLLGCSGPEFLDFIEDIFKTDVFWRRSNDAPRLVSEINEFLRIDSLPVALTDYVTQSSQQPSPFGGSGTVLSTSVREYPRIIAKDSEPMYNDVIEPALTLLSRADFAVANAEYLTSLEDLRKGDYGDCLTKCCAALESTMKVICALKHWPCQPTDTANTLIKTILANTDLDSYFETTLQLAATLRNRLGTAHGGGMTPRAVPRHVAAYGTHLVGASILLLVAESGV